MKIFKVLTILFFLPVGHAMGAAAADFEGQADHWPAAMIRQYGGELDTQSRLEAIKSDRRMWLEEKARIYVTAQHPERWNHLISLVEAQEGPKWFDNIVNQLSSEEKIFSDANLDAFLTLSFRVRRWALEMTGHLMTLEPKEDLENWGPLLKKLSDPYVQSYGSRSSQGIMVQLEKIFRKFRDMTNEHGLPEKLDMNYFKSLFQTGEASVSASEAESETD